MTLTKLIYWIAALIVFIGIIGKQQEPWLALIVVGLMAFIINFIGHMCDLSEKH